MITCKFQFHVNIGLIALHMLDYLFQEIYKKKSIGAKLTSLPPLNILSSIILDIINEVSTFSYTTKASFTGTFPSIFNKPV